jgi:hypothetical protein
LLNGLLQEELFPEEWYDTKQDEDFYIKNMLPLIAIKPTAIDDQLFYHYVLATLIFKHRFLINEKLLLSNENKYQISLLKL